VEFPAVTICSQGFNDEIFYSSFYSALFKYVKDVKNVKNISFNFSPIEAVRVYKQVLHYEESLHMSPISQVRKFDMIIQSTKYS
jgi:hypothetical protein